MKQILKKLISVFLVAALLLQLPGIVPVAFAAYTDHVNFGDVALDCYHDVVYDAQKGVYRLSLELDAELYEHRASSNSSVPERGYFTAHYTGDYLIQLWGGNGADGLDEDSRKGGKGGAGGYVYGVVHLEKDQTLFYSLGGNGSTTYVTGKGGGANGGGGGGSSITYGVGGGGGYSAIFLFGKDEFAKYLDANKNLTVSNINETDRATKYLMIAGGGGGGGAAPGTTLIGNNNTRWPADGGAGGTLGSSISGEIYSEGVTVPGTFYAGFNGTSSGTSDSYIGRGGTTTPGVVAATAWSWSQGEKPNDWTGGANSENEPGAGGAGNLRGGAGGGGYCGGSGGIQQSLVSPTQVGGGGGGSSFVAGTVNGHEIITELTSDVADLLDPRPTDIPGGAVSITYIPFLHVHAQSGLDFSAAEDVTISFALAEYFDVSFFTSPQLTVEYKEVDGEQVPAGYEELELTPVGNSYQFTISDIDLIPTANNLTGSLELIFEFVPKTGFAGGNGVPLLQNNTISISTETTNGERETKNLVLYADDCTVNVPLSLPLGLKPQSHVTYVNAANKTFTATQMYLDEYAAIRNNLRSDPMYDYIESIGLYSVGGKPNDTWSTTVTQTTSVPVSLTVTPRETDVRSTAGDWVYAKTFTEQATITVLDPHSGHLNGQTLTFTKQLEYDESDETYMYTLQAEATVTDTSTLPPPQSFDDPNLAADENIYLVPHKGIYFIQVWGGNGANGYDASSKFTGGAGGQGGYADIYLTLEEGDSLRLMQMGQAGKDTSSSSTVAGGGTYTGISRCDAETGNVTPIVIAGGGGGGGNGVRGNFITGWGAVGLPGASVATTESVLSGDLTVYNGSPGEVGSGFWDDLNFQGGAGGDAGKNYTAQAAQALTDAGAARLDEARQTTTNPAGNAGIVLVTCLELIVDGHVDNTLTDYSLDLQFSDYFQIIPPDTEPQKLLAMAPRPNFGNIYVIEPDTKPIPPPGDDPVYSITPDTELARPPGDDPVYSITPDTELARPPGDDPVYSITPDTELARPPGDDPVYSITPDTELVRPPGDDPVYSITPDTELVRPSDPGGIYKIGPDTGLMTFALTRNTLPPITPLWELNGVDSWTAVLYDDQASPPSVTVSGIAPTIAEDPDTGASSICFSLALKLKARDGFLGGNNVPLLTAATISQPLHDEDGNPTSTVNSAPVPTVENADFANVVFDGYTPDLTVTDQNLGTGQNSVATAELYEWDNRWDGTAYTWEDDFLTPIETLIQEGGTDNLVGVATLENLTRNTHYDVTVGVGPIYAPAEVGPAMSDATVTKEVSVFVLPRITYRLEQLSTSIALNPEHNCASLFEGEDHVSILSPVSEGFTLPASISVTYDDGSGAVPCSYDSKTGEVFISSDHATKDMTVTASAVRRTFSITYAYEDPITGNPVTVIHQRAYGAPIDPWDWDGGSITGYDFAWNWYWRDGIVQNTMPAYDLTVVGIYTPKTYTVTVKYYEAGKDDELTDAYAPVSGTYAFGTPYSIQTPFKAGYVSDKPIVSGTVDKAAVEALEEGETEIIIKVTYTESSNLLRVNHVLKSVNVNTGEFSEYTLLEATTRTVTKDEQFTVVPLEAYKDGYEIAFVDSTVDGELTIAPDGNSATGVMDENGAEVTVTYTPMEYTVTFETGGGVINGDSYNRTVLFGNLYRLRIVTDGEGEKNYQYVSLPTQVIKRGYAFDGWYLDEYPAGYPESNTDLYAPVNRITSDHEVDIAGNHTLYAKWVPKKYSLTVEYDFENGTEARPSDVYSFGYNEDYYIDVPRIPGYTAHRNGVGGETDHIAGQMPAEFVVRQIIYKPIDCTLTINYAYAANVTGSGLPALPSPHVETLKFGEDYRVETPELASNDVTYYASQSVVEGIMDDPDGKEITVYYYKENPVISVTIDWGDLTFIYDRGTWNTSTLRYENGSITPKTETSNRITVTNSASNVSVIAQLAYEPYDRAPDIAGEFLVDDAPATSVALARPVGDNKPSAEIRLSLSGTLPRSMSGTLTSGRCIVTIATGGG